MGQRGHLNAEMDFHLNNTDFGRVVGNSRNGYGKKTLKSNFGHLELSTPKSWHIELFMEIKPKVKDIMGGKVLEHEGKTISKP